MKVVITGATGLVGRTLTAHLSALGHRVEVFSRPSDWNPDSGSINTKKLEGADASFTSRARTLPPDVGRLPGRTGS